MKSTPWNISNIDENLYSPDKTMKIEYYRFGEIAMGSPLICSCKLYFKDLVYDLGNSFACPSQWSSDSKLLIIPFWTNDRKQKISIIFIDSLEIIRYKEKFSVIDIEKIEDGFIYGIDSPIYIPKRFKIPINRLTVESKNKIN